MNDRPIRRPPRRRLHPDPPRRVLGLSAWDWAALAALGIGVWAAMLLWRQVYPSP